MDITCFAWYIHSLHRPHWKTLWVFLWLSESTNNTTPPPKPEPNPEKIPIEYTFSWSDEGNNKGIVGVANNVGLPFIKYGIDNVTGQGGGDKIKNDYISIFASSGDYLDGIMFDKTGTPVIKSNAKFRVVSRGI